MDKKSVAELFRNFDLSDYESRTYSALLFIGPSKVSEISRESKVPQSKIYEILEKLMAKQLVEVYGIRPKEFRAVHPNVALKGLLEEKENELIEMKEKMSILTNFLRETNSRSEVMEGVWTTKETGWKNFINRLSEMFDRSQNYAFVVSRDFSWSSRLAESVKIKLFNTAVHPRIIDVDGKELLLRLDTDSTKRDRFSFTSVWSKDASLIKVIDTYVKSLWKESKNFNFNKTTKSKVEEDREDDYGENY